MHKQIFNRHGDFPKRHPILGWRIIERHDPQCECSYEEQAQRRLGVMVPKSKMFNSWWIVYLRTSGGTYYARTTLPWLPRPLARA